MLMDYITMYIRLQPASKSTAAAGTSQVALYIYIQIHICIYRATRTWLPATNAKANRDSNSNANAKANYIPGHLPERQQQHRSDLAWPTLLGAVPKLTALRHFKIYAAELSIMAVLCAVCLMCRPVRAWASKTHICMYGMVYSCLVWLWVLESLTFSRPSIYRLLSFIKNPTRRWGVQSVWVDGLWFTSFMVILFYATRRTGHIY